MITQFIVHIAGPVQGGNFQPCARCGIPLTDYRGVSVMVPQDSPHRSLAFWPEGSFIGADGRCSILMSRDAIEADEIPCGVAQ